MRLRSAPPPPPTSISVRGARRGAGSRPLLEAPGLTEPEIACGERGPRYSGAHRQTDALNRSTGAAGNRLRRRNLLHCSASLREVKWKPPYPTKGGLDVRPCRAALSPRPDRHRRFGAGRKE